MTFPPVPKIKVLLAATHNVFINTFAEIFNKTDFNVSNVIAEKATIYQFILKNQPHIVFFHGEIALELVKQVKANFSIAARCVLVLPPNDESTLIQGIYTLADALIAEKKSDEEYLRCIERLKLGERYISQTFAEKIFFNPTIPHFKEMLDKLGKKEHDVFRYIGYNFTIQQIADKLCISPNTVDSHRNNLIKKLGLQNAKELRQLASKMVYSSN